MKLQPRPRIKTNDLHIRLSLKNYEALKKVSLIRNTSITSVIEEYINQLEVYHKL